MSNLTFAEQVKIILKRKGMTIKELAETIERETGKKMSRQNLTQRLGRDNFQEQDMRVIAKILGCEFTLDILAGSAGAAEGASAAMEAVAAAGGTKQHEHAAAPQPEVPEPAAEEQPEAAAEPDRAAAASEAPARAGLAISVEEKVMDEKERDITIGELVDIHKELDELESAEAARVPENEQRTEAEAEAAEAPEDEPEEEPEEAEASEWQQDSADDAGEESEGSEPDPAAAEVYAEQESVRYNTYEQGDPEEERIIAGYYDTRQTRAEEPQDMADAEDAYDDEGIPSIEIPDAEEEPEPEDDMEMSLEEIEEVVNEPGRQEEPEEHEEPKKKGGLMGYLSRFAKRQKNEPDVKGVTELTAKEEERVGEEPEAEEAAANDEAAAEAATPEMMDGVIKNDPEVMSEPDVNPYTGIEYESNSVRVHPNRIGYVQVYDRRDHKWTDMTEWAFLGYQERKKVLLGDAYEPPVYLD